jgi:hypothetical protein
MFITLLLLDMLPCLYPRRNLCCITSSFVKSSKVTYVESSLCDSMSTLPYLLAFSFASYQPTLLLSPALSILSVSTLSYRRSCQFIHLQLLFSLAVVINVLFTESTFPRIRSLSPCRLIQPVCFSSTFVLSAFRLYDSTRRFILHQLYLSLSVAFVVTDSSPTHSLCYYQYHCHYPSQPNEFAAFEASRRRLRERDVEGD